MAGQSPGARKYAAKQRDELPPKNLTLNRQAGHYYHLLEKFEAGIELTGTEVKSIRDGNTNLKDGYAAVKDGQAWLINCHIGAYHSGSYLNHDALRDRRLLLHRREVEQQGGPPQGEGESVAPPRVVCKRKRS